MNIALIIALILVLLVALVMAKGDVFAPECILAIAYLFSAICVVYQMKFWNYQITFSTLIIILISLLSAILIGLLTRYMARKRTLGRSKITHITPIPQWAVALCVLIVTITCIATAYQIVRIGGTGSLADVMINYRQQSAYGTDLEEKLPGWVSQLQNISSVIGYLFLFNLIYFFKDLRAGQKATNAVVIIGCCLAGMMTGGRFGVLCMFVGGIIMFWIIRHRRGESTSVRISTVLKISAIFVAILVLFYYSKDFVGRATDYDAIDYLTHYGGGGIVGFDMYLQAPFQSSDIFGKETFYSLNNGLRKLGIIDIPYYLIHHEFRMSNGVGIGNIYTALRDYHHDFGFLGMVVLHLLFCFIMSYAYENTKRNGSMFGIIVLAMIYYCIPLYSISNYLYANIVSFGFLIKLFEAFVLYRLFFEKRLFRTNSVSSNRTHAIRTNPMEA